MIWLQHVVAMEILCRKQLKVLEKKRMWIPDVVQDVECERTNGVEAVKRETGMDQRETNNGKH